MTLRARIALGVLLATALLAGRWYWTGFRPRAAALAGREAEVAAMRTANRDARARDLALGIDSVDALRRRSRAEADRLAVRVPPRGEAAPHPFAETLAGAARRLGVRVHGYQPLPPAGEGEFQVDGMRATVAGRYHDVGALMAELLSQPRLTQLRAVRLAVVPDSLMAGSAAEPPAAEADSALAIPAGEAPFNVVAAFSLHWFSVGGPVSPAPPAGETMGVPLDPTPR